MVPKSSILNDLDRSIHILLQNVYQDRDIPTFHQDRDETERLGKCVSRQSRDRNVKSETTSVLQKKTQ